MKCENKDCPLFPMIPGAYRGTVKTNERTLTRSERSATYRNDRMPGQSFTSSKLCSPDALDSPTIKIGSVFQLLKSVTRSLFIQYIHGYTHPPFHANISQSSCIALLVQGQTQQASCSRTAGHPVLYSP